MKAFIKEVLGYFMLFSLIPPSPVKFLSSKFY